MWRRRLPHPLRHSGATTLRCSSARCRNSVRSVLRLNGPSNIGIASRKLVASDQPVWCPRLRASRRWSNHFRRTWARREERTVGPRSSSDVRAEPGLLGREGWRNVGRKELCLRSLVRGWRMCCGVGFKVAQEALKFFVVPEQSGRGEEEVIEFLVGQRQVGGDVHQACLFFRV